MSLTSAYAYACRTNSSFVMSVLSVAARSRESPNESGEPSSPDPGDRSSRPVFPPGAATGAPSSSEIVKETVGPGRRLPPCRRGSRLKRRLERVLALSAARVDPDHVAEVRNAVRTGTTPAAVLDPAHRSVDLVIHRRGVHVDDSVLDPLRQLEATKRVRREVRIEEVSP